MGGRSLSSAGPAGALGLLRLEGAAVFAGCILLYAVLGHSWILFLILLLAPDLGMIGYAVNPAIGARTYNAAHFQGLPVMLGIAGWWAGIGTAVAVAVIWAAHIGMDRMLGYGLKLPTGFKDTHLGRIGGA